MAARPRALSRHSTPWTRPPGRGAIEPKPSGLMTKRQPESVAVPIASAPRQRAPMSARLMFRSEEHTSELQSLTNLVCRLLLEKKTKRKEAHRDETASEQRRLDSRYTRTPQS